jgi:1,4-dihydroxy-2-naphthoyl-CoA synthase
MTTDLEAAIDFSINAVMLNFMTRDQKEAMAAFLEKREGK